MFDIKDFVMKTLKGMIGAYPDFQVREYALNWYAKGKLTEEDLAEIDALIEAQYIVPEPPVEPEIEDETFLDDGEGTETEAEETETTTEIVEENVQEEPTSEPTE